MTNSTQEHYLDYIDILESLQRWLAYHTNSVQTYRRDGTHQLKPFENIMAELAEKGLTLDTLVPVALSDNHCSLMSVTVSCIYAELKISIEDQEYPLTQIFTHIHENELASTDYAIKLLDTLLDAQIRRYRKILTNSPLSPTVEMGRNKEVAHSSMHKMASSACLKRYFCCVFNFYKANKYPEGENISLLSAAKQPTRDTEVITSPGIPATKLRRNNLSY